MLSTRFLSSIIIEELFKQVELSLYILYSTFLAS